MKNIKYTPNQFCELVFMSKIGHYPQQTVKVKIYDKRIFQNRSPIINQS